MPRLDFVLSCISVLIMNFLWTPPVWSKPVELRDRVFFIRDIFLFTGHPYPSLPLKETLPFHQRFRPACSNLSRVILAFAVKEKSPDMVTFQLFREDYPDRIIYKEIIDTSKFSISQKMGSHPLKGTFHSIWLPIQEDSKNKWYFWKLSSHSGLLSDHLRLYLTDRTSLQVPTLSGNDMPKARAAFYTFCQYRFNWEEIIKKIGQRFQRELGFLIVLFFLAMGIGYLTLRENSRFRSSQ